MVEPFLELKNLTGGGFQFPKV